MSILLPLLWTDIVVWSHLTTEGLGKFSLCPQEGEKGVMGKHCRWMRAKVISRKVMGVLSMVNTRSLTGGEGAYGRRRNKEQVQEPMKWKWNGQHQKCQVRYSNKGKATGLFRKPISGCWRCVNWEGERWMFQQVAIRKNKRWRKENIKVSHAGDLKS